MERRAALLATLAVAPLAALLVYYAVVSDPHVLYADEPYYVEASLHLLELLGVRHGCEFGFARKIEPVVRMGYLNLEHPPLAKLLLAAVYAGGLCDARAGRLLAAASTIAALVMLAYVSARIVLRLYGFSLRAVAVYLVFWWMLVYSTLDMLGWMQMLEPFALLFSALALTLEWGRRSFGSAIAAGLALATKLTTVPVAMVLLASWRSRLGARRALILATVAVLVFIGVHAVYSAVTGVNLVDMLMFQFRYHTLKAYAPGVRGTPLDALMPYTFVMCTGGEPFVCARPNVALLLASLFASAYALLKRCECTREALAYVLTYPTYIAFAIAIYVAGASVYSFYLGVYEPFAAFTAATCLQPFLGAGVCRVERSTSAHTVEPRSAQ